jgi:hypothetical protein
MKAERPADFIAVYFERSDRGLQPIAVLLLDIDADRLHIRARPDCRSVAGPENAPVLETMLSDLAADARKKGRFRLFSGERAGQNPVRAWRDLSARPFRALIQF